MSKPTKKTYTEPTEEQIEAIKKVFWLSRDGGTFSIHTLNDGYYIHVGSGNEYVPFSGSYSTLTAYLEIAKILGVNQGRKTVLKNLCKSR